MTSYSEQQISSSAGRFSHDSYTTVVKDRVFVVAVHDADVIGFGQLNPVAAEVEADGSRAALYPHGEAPVEALRVELRPGPGGRGCT